LLNGIEWNVRAGQPSLEFGDAASRIVHHYVQAVTGQDETGDPSRVFELFTRSAWIGGGDRQNSFAQLGLEIRRRVAEEQLTLME
jgi:hypothetical protein